MRAASDEQLATIVAGLSALPNQARTVAINVALARARVQLDRRLKRAHTPVQVAAPAVVQSPAGSPPARQVFTEQEQADLRRLFPTATWPDLLLVAPGRTRSQIMSWAMYHGLRRTKEAKAIAQSQATKGKSKRNGKEEKLPATPVLNARVSAKARKDGPTAIGRMLEQMRQLLPSHPRRLAYALAARTGTGQDAYQAWLNWKPQQAI